MTQVLTVKEVLLQKIFFHIRRLLDPRPRLRQAVWTLGGAQFGAGTRVPKVTINWPHQVSVGRRCILEEQICFKFDDFWRPGPSIVVGDRVFLGSRCEFNIRQRIEIGDDCLIASGCKFIDHDHGLGRGSGPMNTLAGVEAAIRVEEDVWLGVNVVVLKGVTIGRGAVVGAGAVVTHSIPAYEIWAGIPARRIGCRPPVAEHEEKARKA